jgi:hypothetical protein
MKKPPTQTIGAPFVKDNVKTPRPAHRPRSSKTRARYEAIAAYVRELEADGTKPYLAIDDAVSKFHCSKRTVYNALNVCK